jgi:hypothetical protein
MNRHLCRAALVFALTVTSVFARAGSGSIVGTVRDASGAPVASAEVYAMPVTTSPRRIIPFSQTDASGQFSIDYLAPGKYKVFAAKPSENYPPTGFAAFYSNNQIRHEVVAITQEHPQARVTISLGPRGALVYGRFVDARRSSPIEGQVTVSRIADPRKTFSTAFRENYRVLVPADVEIELEVTADGYEPWSYVHAYGRGLRLEPGKDLQVDINLVPTAPK